MEQIMIYMLEASCQHKHFNINARSSSLTMILSEVGFALFIRLPYFWLVRISLGINAVARGNQK